MRHCFSDLLGRLRVSFRLRLRIVEVEVDIQVAHLPRQTEVETQRLLTNMRSAYAMMYMIPLLGAQPEAIVAGCPRFLSDCTDLRSQGNSCPGKWLK